MKKILWMILTLATVSCQDQLDIINPNEPSPQSANTEEGIIAQAQGVVYKNGISESKFSPDANFFGTVLRYHEIMGDVVYADMANFYFNQIGNPDEIILDNGDKLITVNPGGHKAWMRSINISSSQGNPFVHEWYFMYTLNGALNNLLSNLDKINFPGDSQTKSQVIRAWIYFWKGYAYSRIGSMYYAGLINENFGKTNNLYVPNTTLLAEAENNYSKAEEILENVVASETYNSILSRLIPDVCQTGKGIPPDPAMWIRNINTLRARNILVNSIADQINPELWNKIAVLATNGIEVNDNVFTIRTDALGNLLRANGIRSYPAASAVGPPSNGGGDNKISERLIQDFKPGDARFDNNFVQISTHTGPPDRGTAFNTRYIVVDGGNGLPGVITYVNRTIGADEVYMAGTFEENTLILAEAHINNGNLDAGLTLIDEIRNYQGASLATVAGSGMTKDEAKEELRRERRVALAFRGLSFYDARRWGLLKNGRTGSVVVDFDGTVNTNATIHFGYLGYWDVPIAESFYNPPSSDSTPIVNPN